MSINSYLQLDEYKLKQSEDDKCCVLKFSKCDDKHPLWNLNKRELKDFIKFCKKVENMPWKDIRSDTGLNYESLKGINKPLYLSEDITLHSMRLSQKSRIVGYREHEFFYIVWFDYNHKTC